MASLPEAQKKKRGRTKRKKIRRIRTKTAKTKGDGYSE
jgi:hypothetical protein